MNMSSRSQKIRSDLSSILSRITRLTDRQTNRILIARPRLHFMQSGKKLKKIGHVMRHNYTWKDIIQGTRERGKTKTTVVDNVTLIKKGYCEPRITEIQN